MAHVIDCVTEAGRPAPGRGGATAFVAAAGAAVAASVLAVFLRVQLNLVGRYLYLDLAFETAQVGSLNSTQCRRGRRKLLDTMVCELRVWFVSLTMYTRVPLYLHTSHTHCFQPPYWWREFQLNSGSTAF